jgi:Peptidase C39 family
MTILLLTLFAVTLAIIAIGFWLSPRTQASDQQELFYPDRSTGMRRVYGARQTYDARQGYGARQARPRRLIARYDERRRWSPDAYLSTLFNVKNIFDPRAGKQISWLGILVILIALFGFTFFSLNSLLLNPGLIVDSSWIKAPLAPPATPVPATPSTNQLLSGLSGASKSLIRIYQLDPNQYASTQDFNKWAYSACSAAAMTEVINSYGHSYRIADILSVEARLGEITPELGLVEPTGIDRTVAQFGFQTIALKSPSLNDVIRFANQGRPVIVSFPPSRWDGGHLLVVRGGDDNNVTLADSSRYNMTVIPRSKFLQWWGGFAVVVIPK